MFFKKDGKDVTVNDRIKLYYLNFSLCEEHCTFINVSIETFEVESSCSMQNTETKKLMRLPLIFWIIHYQAEFSDLLLIQI